MRVLYVSPLKALVYDIERNLRAPLVGIAAEAEAAAGVLGRVTDAEAGPVPMAAQSSAKASATSGAAFRSPRIGIRTGDTTAKERRLLLRDPAEILVTTPESLYLMLGSKARETLRQVETIIIDEIHALAPTKRGTHLMLSLERVARGCWNGDPQRIGLSATAKPTETIARFLGGGREIAVVDTSRRPDLSLTVSVPVPDMTRPEVGGRRNPEEGYESVRAVGKGEADTSLWPAIYPELLDQIRAHKSSILFVNSRALCERLAHRLNELAEEDLVRAHHGSLAHEKRKEIEGALAAGGVLLEVEQRSGESPTSFLRQRSALLLLEHEPHLFNICSDVVNCAARSQRRFVRQKLLHRGEVLRSQLALLLPVCHDARSGARGARRPSPRSRAGSTASGTRGAAGRRAADAAVTPGASLGSLGDECCTVF